MNTKLFPVLAVAVSVLGIGMAVVAGEPADRASRKPAVPSALYTCAMHPEIRWSKPDDCPVCGMKLTAVNARKQLPKVDDTNHEEMQMDHGAMQHDGMPMDHASMGPMMGGCGMCMEMMDMSSMRQAPAPAARKIAAPRHRGRGRGAVGRGCGC